MHRLLIAFFVIVCLTGCTNTNGVSTTLSDKTANSEISNNSYGKISVENYSHPAGDYYVNDIASASVKISNSTKEEKEIWVELKILNHNKILIYSDNDKIIVSGEGRLEHEISWTVPQNIQSGNYQSVITVWASDPEKESQDSSIIFQDHAQQGILCYRNHEDFDILDQNIWKISSKKLGRTKIKSTNVFVNNGMLEIHMPKGILEGGEISTVQLQGYGAYEIRMKLPYARSSITGFFLYKSPDYYYEIDIELYNDESGKLLLTTYSDGKTNNECSCITGFDPTLDFHEYRLEYYEDLVGFYVDNKLVKSWTSGFPKGEMQLMVNSWYPNWLEGIPAESEQVLYVDWIRY